jgi:hypothetical protein
MKNVKYLFVLALVVILVGCAPGPNPMAKTADEEGEVAGFWAGLWHGFIAPFTFIGSIFSDKVHFYEVHNNGFWYNLAYFIGLTSILGGGGGGAASRRRWD